jgi:chorismate-pyruvate lyase
VLGRFASPITRILLSSEGLTTTLLESLAGEPLGLRCLAQLHVRAGDAGPGVPALLGVPAGASVLVRHSTTHRSCGETLSVNHVVARVDLATRLGPAVVTALASPDRPLGPALAAMGTGHRRTLLDAGRRSWGPRPACFKTYLVWHGDQPLVLIHELFNPAVVPAG